MKRFLIALNLVLLSNLAIAQSSVTIYGSLDEGITYVSNEHGGHAAVVSPVAVPDFFGFRGVEDLGGGTKALFRLETGFRSNNGTNLVAGDMFSRVAMVGLSSPWGGVTLGRQFDLTNETLMPNANGVLQYAYYLMHPGNLDNIGVTEVNNSIKYSTPDFGGLSFAVEYGMADSTTQPGRVLSVDGIYNRGPFRVAAVYSSWHDRSVDLATTLGYSSFLGQTLGGGKLFTAKSTDITGIAGRYQVSQYVAIHGMVTHISFDAPLGSAHMATAEAGADLSVSPFNTVTIGGYVSSLTGTHYQEIGLGDLYSLSKSTIVYAQTIYQHANGLGHPAMPLLAPSDDSSQLIFRIGVHHFF